ncbi:MAG: HAMP domain-containing histidine kinase [Anaeromyxobacter sp.]|nr:HAMP domain-containing histidine kinase [Anaeromyxobacter sp.]
MSAPPALPVEPSRGAPRPPSVRVGAAPLLEDRGRLNLNWLVQLHWWAILGQILIIGAAELWSEISLPIATLIGFIALEALGNLALGFMAQRVRVTDGVVAAVMLLDAVVLTVILDLTGGATNPFSTLYLVNVVLAAVLLPRRWSWGLLAVSLAGYGSLFVHEGLTSRHHHVTMHMEPGEVMGAHLRGMWMAFGLAALFIVYFVRRVAAALAERERELGEARALVQRREKLASLATLAAGAAHELSTPLSTIAVVAKELQRALADDTSPEVRADLQLVRDQVGRCREILDRMSANAGEAAGEPMAAVALPAWVSGALDGFPARERIKVEYQDGAEGAAIVGPPRALADTLRGLLKNAVQASGPGLPVTLRLALAGGLATVTVVDHGRGMPAEVLARAGEPFFTTKVPGEGMGLGLFLTRTLAEQLGGEFHIASRPGIGTEARIELPAAKAGERSYI